MKAEGVKAALQEHANPDDAVFLQRFFKTGKGYYGEGDVFIGVRVPVTRQICKRFRDLPLPEVQKLLNSPIHEHRLAAVIILTYQYLHASDPQKQAIFDLYLKNVYQNRINNWDIVDVSAEKIIGPYLDNRDKAPLLELAHSDNIWQKRVALLSTFHYIKVGDPSAAFAVIDILLHDPHDLIQKATGWMLREIGKRANEQILTRFLDKHAHDMPRTALRYAIERLSPAQKIHYMAQKSAYIKQRRT